MELFRKPLAKIDDDDPLTGKDPQQRAFKRAQSKLDGCSRHRYAAKRAQLAHPKTEMAVPKPDFSQLQADASGYAFPGHRRLHSQRITLSSEGQITDGVTARQQLVEMPFDASKIQRQVEPVPTGQRRRQ